MVDARVKTNEMFAQVFKAKIAAVSVRDLNVLSTVTTNLMTTQSAGHCPAGTFEPFVMH